MRRQSDLNDIYGVKRMKANPLEQDNEVPETGFRHSDSYHKYFRGYTEIRREKPNGRYRVERYYTQPWIVSGASKQVYWLIRLVYAACVCVSWILYVWAMCMDLGSNRAWFVAIPGFPAAVMLLLLSIVTCNYIFIRKKMTLWDHESSTKRLKTVSLLTGGCIALTAAAKVAYTVTVGGNAAGEWSSAGMALLAAGFAAGICRMERDMVYTTIPNDTVLPEGEAHEIW